MLPLLEALTIPKRARTPVNSRVNRQGNSIRLVLLLFAAQYVALVIIKLISSFIIELIAITDIRHCIQLYLKMVKH